MCPRLFLLIGCLAFFHSAKAQQSPSPVPARLNPAYMTRFEHDVQSHLERGIPLLWSVTLGLLPEENLTSQVRGGHMRLIIGYNARTREIYYSDTWGIGHELKKMPLANAWTITTGLFTLEPI